MTRIHRAVPGGGAVAPGRPLGDHGRGLVLRLELSASEDRARRSPPAASPPPAPIEPDTSPEFAGLRDKTPLSFRDTAAYATLLERARGVSADALAAQARRDLLFTHLWERPEKYRGVPVHLLGTARRVLSYESKLSRTGRLYEAWIFTPESQNHPYVCVFEDSARGLPGRRGRLRAGRLQRLFPQVDELPGRRRPPGGPAPDRTPRLVADRAGCGEIRPRAALLDGPGPWPDVPRLVLTLALADAPLAHPPAATLALRPQARRRDRPRSALRLAQLGLRGGERPPLHDVRRSRPHRPVPRLSTSHQCRPDGQHLLAHAGDEVLLQLDRIEGGPQLDHREDHGRQQQYQPDAEGRRGGPSIAGKRTLNPAKKEQAVRHAIVDRRHISAAWSRWARRVTRSLCTLSIARTRRCRSAPRAS